MKTNSSLITPLFTDQPLTKPRRRARPLAPSLLTCEEGTDYLEAGLRIFLVLCLLGSLAMCGLTLSGSSKTPVASPTAAPVVPSEEIAGRVPAPASHPMTTCLQSVF